MPMPMQISIPSNCTECVHSEKCNNAYYSSLNCRYHEILTEMVVNRTLGRDSKNLCKQN